MYRRFCGDSRWEYRRLKTLDRFSRLFDDYLDLHLFCKTTLMKGRLTRARECMRKGEQWRVRSEFGALTLLMAYHEGRVLAKASLLKNKPISLE